MIQIIKDSLTKAIDYKKYREQMEIMAEKKTSSGAMVTEDMINYTILNHRRMKRWDKTIKLSEAAKIKLNQNHSNLTWLVLTETWCGDAAHVIPVLHKLEQELPNVTMKIVYRDENDALMTQFLTDGNRAIPKLLILNSTTKEVVDVYGPRPTPLTKMVTAFKEKNSHLTANFKEDIQRWYNQDKGRSIIKDILRLLE